MSSEGSNHSEWLGELELRQERYLDRKLSGCLNFLLSAREGEGGWSQYPGMKPDLVATGNVASALHGLDHADARIVLVNLALYFENSAGVSLEELDYEGASGLLSIAGGDKALEPDYAAKLVDTIRNLVAPGATGDDDVKRLPVPAAKLIIALTRLPDIAANDPLIGDLIESLIDQQNQHDGGWSVVMGEPSQLIPTAWAVCALAAARPLAVDIAIQRGVGFLSDFVNDAGWDAQILQNTYAKSIVLRALGASGFADDRLVDQGIDEVLQLLNDDGGAGANIGAPSTVEYTAAVLAGALAAGADRYAPARVANMAVKELIAELRLLKKECSELRESVESTATSLCGQIMEERDRLKREVKSQRDDLVQIRRQAARSTAATGVVADLSKSAAKRKNAQTTRFMGWSYWAAFTVAGVAAVASIVTFLSLQDPAYNEAKLRVLFIIGLIGSAGVLMVYVLATRFRPLLKSQNELIGDPALSQSMEHRHLNLLVAFMEITDDLPRSLRRTLMASFVNRLIDVPSDIFSKLARGIIIEVGLPRKAADDLEQWTKALSRLPKDERRLILLTLARGI